MTLHGIRLDVSSPALDAETRRQLYRGRYQHEKLRQLGAKVEPNDTFLDIGAGLGLTALFAASMVGEDNVIAVEADPHAATLARANFALNERAIRMIEGAVTTRGAASEEDGGVDFYPNAAFGASACFPRAGGTESIRVPRVDLAPLLAERQITAVNVDAPGSECDIIGAVDDFGAVRVLLVTIREQASGYPRTVELTRHLFDRDFALDFTDSCGQEVVFVRTP